ncbi:hypothetical protein C440_00445 [Haloferax mucosum ATCC BAA-1512]|uniref:Uncharacterized protein n=1 Tax=Haloferax mucosum ATCC BAA-1512 TaxID=662479 RepID=M0ITG6_9EURY|nr:hypothetical protein [Haloferax mucosum]ELZ98779.1 hypothetical protein C440_00445 [Haloferax mucosum ATCC BAA-1512]
MALSYTGRTEARQIPTTWWLAALCWFELLAVAAYLHAAPVRVDELRYVIYPFVWINVGIAALCWTERPTADRRVELVAGVVAVAYFFVLAFLAGLLSVNVGALVGDGHVRAAGHAGGPAGWQFALGAPGWGPRVGYAGTVVSATVVPYRVVGYLALSYLVYVATLDAARTALSGALGLVTCVGCTVPLVGGLAAGAAGGTGVVSALRVLSVDVSTAVFVVAVGALMYGPKTVAWLQQ